MRLQLQASSSQQEQTPIINITGSKSESNRLLILQQLFPNLQIKNLSTSDDTQHLQEALESTNEILDIGHAGTAMRFITALMASSDLQRTVTGSDRMKQRPIGILVDALRYLGAQIDYVENEGFPPLKIKGNQLHGGEVTMDAGVSSQFLSALLLVAPRFENGLTLRLSGKLTSRPYLEMTTGLMQLLGLDVTFEGQVIKVKHQSHITDREIVVESDWSSAGYWYSWVAMQPAGYSVQLNSYKDSSLQGDRALVEIYEKLGVQTTFNLTGIVLTCMTDFEPPHYLEFDLTSQPDQAQTIFATCLGLGINLKMKGLHTLRIKETDRIKAMDVVGSRFRESKILTTTDTIEITFSPDSSITQEFIVDTYQDHRMALAFAPLCCKTTVIINDADVVTKSYGEYYKDLAAVKVDITEI
ncbi:3-phosphoshikimate 1-carboxyvinyltransferase [Nonlabens ponticola]|uniref:3-phosphoshikimate 1-carboxyvinyltransferase n=1 Tax=Nonlabens ponticola TaxID=2496866 RepID=A0A3S9MWS7_9FLAO|nr:3-phosphoshikimate 1-carboxyvinyltransferase [Nonlabens ponticola]AZQ43573.1 3-phosphoshikimate 1-carboxyvinyltransferase [Nonlabens ponticola]